MQKKEDRSEKRAESQAEIDSKCTVKYYGYFNGEYNKCVKNNKDPAACKIKIQEEFQACLTNNFK